MSIIDSIRSDGDTEWKPEKNLRNFDDTDDVSSDESERELTNREATRFIDDSSTKHRDSTNKKPRLDDDDDD